ncbi:hypothetical protein NMY22_g16100 [Coprinellus aureogranulatus]|nr:hypothetical protein NMY22_g16100 [Coprinellus aureogranulatus]
MYFQRRQTFPCPLSRLLPARPQGAADGGDDSGSYFSDYLDFLNGCGYDALSQALQRVHSEDNGSQWIDELSSGEWTVFAPSNQAFQSANSSLTDDTDTLFSYLSYHISHPPVNVDSDNYHSIKHWWWNVHRFCDRYRFSYRLSKLFSSPHFFQSTNSSGGNDVAVGNVFIGRTLLNDTDFVNLEGPDDDERRRQVLAWTAVSGQVTVLNLPTNVTVGNSTAWRNLHIANIDQILNIPGNLSTTLAAVNDTPLFTLLHQAQLPSNDDDDDGGSTSAIDALEDVRGFTFFAPNAEAFTSEFNSSLQNYQNDQSALTTLIQNHYINGSTVYSPTLFEYAQDYAQDGSGDESVGDLISAAGLGFTISQNETGLFVSNGNGSSAQIVQSDILVENGVVHLIDRFLINGNSDASAADSAYSSATSAATETSTDTAIIGGSTGGWSSSTSSEETQTQTTTTSESTPSSFRFARAVPSHIRMAAHITNEVEFDPKNMIFRRLGNSGLRVPVFSLGGFKDIIKTAFDAGINMFDTAEVYAGGKSEEEMGRVIKELNLKRSDLVISTKLYWGGGKAPNNSEEKPWTVKRQPYTLRSYLTTLFFIFLGAAGGAALCFFGYTSVPLLDEGKLCMVLDEQFNGGSLDEGVWNREVQLGGFGNGQFEMTTNDDENLFFANGQLYIHPTLTTDILPNILDQANYTLPDCRVINPVRSARINTKGKKSIKYGKVEVKAKMPQGDWLWPAIWMMPEPVVDNNRGSFDEEGVYGKWPLSGEIDIVEARGNAPEYPHQGRNYVRSSLNYGPLPSLYRQIYGWQSMKRSSYSDSFHTFTLEWTDTFMRMYVDKRVTAMLEVNHLNENKGSGKTRGGFWARGRFPKTAVNGSEEVVVENVWERKGGGANAPFDQPFYLIINLAAASQPKQHPEHHGYSRLSLHLTKWVWSSRRAHHEDNSTLGIISRHPPSGYGATTSTKATSLPTLHPYSYRPRLHRRMPSVYTEEKKPDQPPLTMYPRQGDISALRDPYCARADRSFATVPLWTLNKILLLFALHLPPSSAADDSTTGDAFDDAGSEVSFNTESEGSTLIGSECDSEWDSRSVSTACSSRQDQGVDDDVIYGDHETIGRVKGHNLLSLAVRRVSREPDVCTVHMTVLGKQIRPGSGAIPHIEGTRNAWPNSWYGQWELLIELVARDGPVEAPSATLSEKAKAKLRAPPPKEFRWLKLLGGKGSAKPAKPAPAVAAKPIQPVQPVLGLQAYGFDQKHAWLPLLESSHPATG